MRVRLADPLTALLAALSIAAPFLREHADMHAMSGGAMSIGATLRETVAERILASLLLLFAVFLVAVRRRRGSMPQRLAALPPLHTAFLAGSAVAIGLGSFDLCSTHHAAAGGICYHCWLTGLLAALGALAAGLVCLTGRTLAELTRDVFGVLLALFVMLERAAGPRAARLRREHGAHILSGPRLARHISSRAPPLLA